MEIRWAGHVAGTGERRGVYRALVEKPEGKLPFGRLRHRWEENIEMDLHEVGCRVMEWIEEVHYRIHKCYHLSLPGTITIQYIPPKSLFLKIHLNIILPSMPGSPKWSLYLKWTHQNPVHASRLPQMRYMPRPSHSSWR